MQQVEYNTRIEIATERQAVFKEMEDFATKKDLKELELGLKLEFHQELTKAVNSAKWQVIGAVAAMFFVEVILRYFGV